MNNQSNLGGAQNNTHYVPKQKPINKTLLTLNVQLIGLVIFIVLTVVTSITISALVRESEIFRSDLVQQATIMLDSLEDSTGDFLYWMDIDTIDNLGNSFAENDLVLVLRIYDPRGRILSAPDNSDLKVRLDSDTYGLELINNDRLDLRWESDRLIAGRKFEISRQVLGAAHVELSTASFNAELQDSILRGILSSIIASAFGIMIAIIVSRSITKPITNLVSAADQIASGNLDQPIAITTRSTEVDQLSKSIENMRLNLQAVYQNLEERIAQRTEELQKSRDEAVEARKAADENSRLKSEFLSMMSHELRTPMNAIQGFTDIILERMAGTDYNDKAERYLQKIKINSTRLLGLINDFLDLTRIESGRVELAHLPIKPAEMAQNWSDLLSVLADNKGLALNVVTDPELPEVIYGDEETLTKIAINLVGNAIKFTEEGSVSVDLQKQDKTMIINITDTGVGIPPHAREFIFDEFRQVDMSSKRQHGGTGLGLSIVQKLVIAMGGTVSLQSEVGVGSTFTVMIPIHLE